MGSRYINWLIFLPFFILIHEVHMDLDATLLGGDALTF